MIYLDENRPKDAIKACWKAYSEHVTEYEKEYHSAVSDWKPIAVCNEDEVIGALLAKDGVIHIGIIPEWRGKWASKRVIREMLKYGTKTTLMQDESPAFIERIGFRKKEGWYEFCR